MLKLAFHIIISLSKVKEDRAGSNWSDKKQFLQFNAKRSMLLKNVFLGLSKK